tara:strand:- start:184 stop:540 length:357 start_codon:yes stop_codon:yes gene_type:complete
MALSTTVQSENGVTVRESVITHVSTNDVFNGPKTLTHVRIDNQSGARIHIKLYDALDADDSTVPTMIFSAPANTVRARPIGNGGFAFLVGVTMRGVTGPGTGGTTVPASSSVVDLTGE